PRGALLMNDEKTVAVRLVDNSDREVDFEIGKDLAGAVRGRRIGRTHDFRGGERNALLDTVGARRAFLVRADEAQRGVILEVVEVRLLERGAGRKLRPFEG